MNYKLYTDGGARGNPGNAGAGVVLLNSQNQPVAQLGKYLGICTNNEAEYAALILGLKLAQANDAQTVTCYLDSELIVKQLNGQYKVKNERLQRYFDKVLALKMSFFSVMFIHIPRAQNKEADKLVNLTLDDYEKTNSKNTSPSM